MSKLKKLLGTKILTTNAQNKEFYSKYLRQVDSWEKTGVDDDGNPTYGYVKRTAFHEPYKYDEFYNDKREFFKKIGVRPNKNDEVAYKDWEARKKIGSIKILFALLTIREKRSKLFLP